MFRKHFGSSHFRLSIAAFKMRRSRHFGVRDRGRRHASRTPIRRVSRRQPCYTTKRLRRNASRSRSSEPRSSQSRARRERGRRKSHGRADAGRRDVRHRKSRSNAHAGQTLVPFITQPATNPSIELAYAMQLLHKNGLSISVPAVSYTHLTLPTKRIV